MQSVVEPAAVSATALLLLQVRDDTTDHIQVDHDRCACGASSPSIRDDIYCYADIGDDDKIALFGHDQRMRPRNGMSRARRGSER